MKICVIGNRYNKFHNDKVMGGLEKVEMDHLKLLSMFGNDVHFITSKDSDKCSLPNVTTHFMSTPSRYSEEGEELGKSLARQRKESLTKLIFEISPDVILTHDDNNSSLNNFLADEIDVPAVVFNHSALAIAGSARDQAAGRPFRRPLRLQLPAA